ncbi:MAG: hypothetical protein P4L65_05285 [Legionella sp.]|nr:hypothetical protein [Legionella sp.]
MFSTSNSSAMRPERPARTQSLTVSIPQRPTLGAVLERINKREEFIELYSLLLTSEDIQRIVAALALVPSNSKMTIKVSELFINPHNEDYKDLLLFWDAVKYKVEKVIWNGNKFYSKFINHLKNDIKTDAKITATNEFLCCDRTDSSNATPSTTKSPSQQSQTQIVSPYSFFLTTPSPPPPQRQNLMHTPSDSKFWRVN